MIRINSVGSEKARMGIVYFVEDMPQFILQITNSFLIGSSWSWIMVASPLISMYSLMDKLTTKMAPTKKAAKK